MRNRRGENAAVFLLEPHENYGSAYIFRIRMSFWHGVLNQWYENTLNPRWNLDQKKNTVSCDNQEHHVYRGRNMKTGPTL